MITSKQCLQRYGDPVKESFMVLFDVPTELEIGVIPKKIYCHKDLVKPLTQAFTNIKERQLILKLKTWDGCFNIRKKRGASSSSLHSWGLAVDINAAWNGFGKTPTMDKELVDCFLDAGFDWGGVWGPGAAGNWKGCDAMHFQLARFP